MNNVVRKDAEIQNIGGDQDFPGSFEVILSTPDLDRDGDTLNAEDWKQPLPSHITFDVDHGMNVASTVGSGVPAIEGGNLVVRGTYSSLPRAQDVRTLVNEGHIRTTSVAFRSEKSTAKDGATRTVRELLNGAFVSVPSNREALVLSAKAGARNSKTDAQMIQQVHDHASALGASCPEADTTGAEADAEGGKSYTADALRRMLADGHAYRNADGDPSYPIGNTADLQKAIQAVGRGGADHDKIRAYIIRRAKDLNSAGLIPDNWNSDGSLKIVADVETKDTTAVETAATDSGEPSKEPDPAPAEQADPATGTDDPSTLHYQAITTFVDAYTA